MDKEIDGHLVDAERAIEAARRAVAKARARARRLAVGDAGRAGRLLHIILEEGGEVTTERFYAIGADLGYDLRGLGGFFMGANHSLEMLEDGRRRLTNAGRRTAEAWAERNAA